MKSTVRLDVECLEQRFAPATWGNPWPDAAHLTLSFAPDGTQVGDHQSQLFQALNSQLKTSNYAVWEQVILRAFQTWAVNANINVSVRPDGGQPFGTTGAFQGDSRFGDLRVGAFSMGADEVMGGDPLAIEEAFDPSAGTWTGDLVLNTAYKFGFNTSNTYDLFTVALHEAGHALGLSHSVYSTDAMYATYNGAKAGLSSNDIARLQALYGTRTGDGGGNDSFGSAAALQVPLSGTVPATNGDISSLSDKDFYKVSFPVLSLGGVSVQVKTTGVSSLMARVTVYDSSYRVVQSVVATDPMNGDISVNLPGSLLSSKTYYVKVESGTRDVFGVGGYQIQAVNSALGVPLVGGLLDAVDVVGNSLTTALGLTPTTTTTDPRFDYAYKSSISSSSDVDYYKLTSPTPPAGMANVMTVYVWGLDKRSLDPAVSVYDSQGNPIAASVLVHENGSMVIQYAPEPGNQLYYVKVAAADPNGPNNVGNYFVGVDFSTVISPVPVMTYGSVGSTTTASPFTLTVTGDLIAHLILSADCSTATTAAVQMTIYDAKGNVVYTLAAMAGDTRSLTGFLAKGTYTIKFTAVSTDGSASPLLNFTLRGLNISDPIDPYPVSSTDQPQSPSGSCPPPPSGSSSYGSSSSGPSSSATW